MEKIIEAELRDFKRKKSVIETTLLRIEAYEKAIKNPESFSGIMPTKSREPGMPTGSSFGSYIEKFITDKEEAKDMLREWIKDDKSRIYPLQVEVEQINGALNALSPQKRYIVECKYFEEDMTWRNIEAGFNEKFKSDIGCERLRKMKKESLKSLVQILEPFYSRIYSV